MSKDSQPYDACLAAALVAAGPMAQQLVTRGGMSMMQAATRVDDASRRAVLVEARRQLVEHKDRFKREFAECLTAAIQGSGDQDEQAAPALSFDTLELIPEEQLDDTVELIRAQELVSSVVESELVHLNALVSAARGFTVVRSSVNPLRPQVWVRALRDATLRFKPEPAIRLLWMHHLGEALGPELADAYRMLTRKLQQEGIAAASFHLTQPPSRHASVATTASAISVRSSSKEEPGRLTLRDLRHLLVGAAPRLDASGDADVTQNGATLDASLTVPFAFDALKTLEQPDQVLRRMQEKHASGAWARAAGSTSRSQPATVLSPVQVLSQEVVTLMVDNMTADVRVLDSVQKAIRELLPALRALVVEDTRFFNDKQHPARQMLEEITRRGQTWSTSSQAGYAAFFDPLQEVVHALAASPAVSADTFEYALHTLKQAWSDAESAQRRLRAATARSLLTAERRNLMAGTIAAEVQKRPDLTSAPIEVKRFIMGPWCQVMASARLDDEHSTVADPGGYGGIINDLIWTSQPRLTASNPARLAQLVPPLLQVLHKGLAKIDYSRDSSRQFFEFLQRVHGLDGPARNEQLTTPPGESSGAHDEDLGMVPWFSPTEIEDTGLMQGRMATPPEDSSTPPGTLTAPDLQPDQLVDVLVQGHWVRWRLNWISPQGLLLMFINDKGKSESMTRQMLERMMGLGALRLLPRQSVVEGALDAVARMALEGSIQAAG